MTFMTREFKKIEVEEQGYSKLCHGHYGNVTE
jgi:hypothetical protein